MKMIYGELFDLFEEMKLLFQKEAEKYDFKDPEKVYVTCDKVIGAIKIMEVTKSFKANFAIMIVLL